MELVLVMTGCPGRSVANLKRGMKNENRVWLNLMLVHDPKVRKEEVRSASIIK